MNELDVGHNYREPTNEFLKVAQQPYMRSAVEKILGLNAKSWKDLEEHRSALYPHGVIPPKNVSYQECIQTIFKYYQSGVEAKIIAAQAKTIEAENKRNYRSADTESGLPKIQEAAIIAKIKLDRAREESIYIDNLKAKGTFIDAEEQYELLGIFLSNVVNELKAVASALPETQEVIDRCFRHLHKLGEIVCQQVDLDSEEFVKRKMEEEVDLDDIIASELL